MAIIPGIANDTVMRGKRAGQQRGVAWRRFGAGVIVMRVGKNRAFIQQLGKAAGKESGKAHEIIITHLIHHDDDGQLWRCRFEPTSAMRQQADAKNERHS